MWLVTITCSAEAWQHHSAEFLAIAAKYPGTPVSSKKMNADGTRIMQYQLEDVGDAESFGEECAALPDFRAIFESL
jgi:hypothetical protein